MDHLECLQNTDESFAQLRESIKKLILTERELTQKECEDFAVICQSPISLLAIIELNHLVGDIPSKALNTILQSGPHKDKSPVLALTSHPLGLKILALHPVLLSKIDQQSLNHIITSGPMRGISPVFFLCSDPDGRGLLNHSNTLVSKIRDDSFNSISRSGLLRNLSPFTLLFNNSDAHDTLDSPHLLSLISESEYNRIIINPHETSAHSIAPAHYAGISQKHRDFVYKHAGIFFKLTSELHLNNPIPGMDQSLIFSLIQDEQFMFLLVQMTYSPTSSQSSNQELITKITASAFNKVYHNDMNTPSSVASWICSSEVGHQVLLNSPCLVDLFDAHSFNHMHWSGSPEDGMSAAYFLASNLTGLDVYKKYPQLAQLINHKGWKSYPEQGDYESISLKKWVCSELTNGGLSTHEGSQVLRSQLQNWQSNQEERPENEHSPSNDIDTSMPYGIFQPIHMNSQNTEHPSAIYHQVEDDSQFLHMG